MSHWFWNPLISGATICAFDESIPSLFNRHSIAQCCLPSAQLAMEMSAISFYKPLPALFHCLFLPGSYCSSNRSFQYPAFRSYPMFPKRPWVGIFAPWHAARRRRPYHAMGCRRLQHFAHKSEGYAADFCEEEIGFVIFIVEVFAEPQAVEVGKMLHV